MRSNIWNIDKITDNWMIFTASSMDKITRKQTLMRLKITGHTPNYPIQSTPFGSGVANCLTEVVWYKERSSIWCSPPLHLYISSNNKNTKLGGICNFLDKFEAHKQFHWGIFHSFAVIERDSPNSWPYLRNRNTILATKIIFFRPIICIMYFNAKYGQFWSRHWELKFFIPKRSPFVILNYRFMLFYISRHSSYSNLFGEYSIQHQYLFWA